MNEHRYKSTVDERYTDDPDISTKDLLNDLFTDSPDEVQTDDADESLGSPLLSIDMQAVNNDAETKAKSIVERLSNYSFDPKYIEEHPYIPNKIAQEIDNIRRLLKMLSINEKAQDTIITSICLNSSKGSLYGALTSLQNSMLSMQSQLTALISNVEKIFNDMQAQCEQTFEEKDKETLEDGTVSSRGAYDLINQINTIIDKRLVTKKSEDANIESMNGYLDNISDEDIEAQDIIA